MSELKASEVSEMSGKIGYDFRDGGSHWHETMIKNKSVHRGGHYHLLDDLKTVLMEGEHIHEFDEESLGAPGWLKGGEHTHKVLFADGTVGYTKPASKADLAEGETTNGSHKHEYTADGEMSRGGQHVHVIEMPDGTIHKTLGHDQIKILIQKGKSLPQCVWDGML